MSVLIELTAIKSEGGTDGGELRACRGCLATDLPLVDLGGKGLAQAFGDFTGIPVVPTDSLPQQVCVTCKHLLAKFYAFRLRCHSAMFVLQELIQNGVEVTTESISALETNYLKPNLTATNIQIVSCDVFDPLSNIPHENPVSNIDLKKEVCDEYVYLTEGKQDELLDIKAVVIEELPDINTSTSSALTESVKWPSSTSCVLTESVKWPSSTSSALTESVKCTSSTSSALTESVKWPSSTSCRLTESVKCPSSTSSALTESVKCPSSTSSALTESGKYPSSTSSALTESVKCTSSTSTVLTESEICPSDELNDIKLATKSKPVKKENATCKIPKNRRVKKEIKESGGDDNSVSSALSECDDWPSDSELNDSKLLTKRKRVNKESATCKKTKNRHVKKEIEESGGDDNSVSSAFSGYDELQSDSKLNDSKLPTKRKRVNKKSVTCKSPKESDAADEEQDMLKRLANILRSIAMVNRDVGYTALWEKVYQESLKDGLEPLDYEYMFQWSLEQKIRQYIWISKKLAALYNCELTYCCLAEQKKEIEDRRASTKYQKAPFKCELCCRHYSFEDTYRRHMVSHDPKSGSMVCEICQCRYTSRRRCLDHYQWHHAKRLLCNTCGAVKRNWAQAKDHFQSHGGATMECEHCGQHFSEKKLYCMHRRQVHREQVATALCLLCGDKFSGAAGLRMHVLTTHKDCPRCPTCSTQFASEEALSVHNAENDGCKELLLSACPVCGHNFPSEQSVRGHYDIMHKRQFKCEQCGRVLFTQTQYRRHLQPCLARKHGARRRRGAKPVYMCEVCGKGNFRGEAQLRSHQRSHTGERPYECDCCGKSFRILPLLKTHMKTHTDERQYKCPHCPKAFRQMGHRAAHILTHTKERPYSCDLCDKSYSGLGTLKQHKDTVHRGLPPRQRNRRKAEELN